MILVGVGTGGDEAVSDSVEIIRRASNGFSTQVHDHVRLEVEAIAATIAGETEKRICIVSHGNQEALVDASVNRVPYLRAGEVGIWRRTRRHIILARAYLQTALEPDLYRADCAQGSALPGPTSGADRR